MADALGRSPLANESFYPININLKGKRVLVCGGGKPALTEISRLMQFGAAVDVVSPIMVAELQDLSLTYGDRISLKRRSFDDNDMNNLKRDLYILVFAYQLSREENAKVVKAASEANVLTCVLDENEYSDYIVPSLIKRGHLKIAISTDSICPPLEKALVQRIESIFVSEIDSYTLFLTSMHELIDRAVKDNSLSDPSSFRRVVRALAESEEIFLALQRKNFEEANHHAGTIVAQLGSSSNEHAAI